MPSGTERSLHTHSRTCAHTAARYLGSSLTDTVDSAQRQSHRRAISSLWRELVYLLETMYARNNSQRLVNLFLRLLNNYDCGPRPCAAFQKAHARSSMRRRGIVSVRAARANLAERSFRIVRRNNARLALTLSLLYYVHAMTIPRVVGRFISRQNVCTLPKICRKWAILL